MGADKIKLGDIIFADIEENEYLNELFETILYSYSLKLFELDKTNQMKEFNLLDALRFADLLSKSTHPERSSVHKMWAQEIVILLNELYGDDPW
jgi:hypothetical protein